MPITIKKRVVAPTPEPLVNPRPPEPEVTTPPPTPARPKAPSVPYSQKPLATSIEDFRKDPNGYRSPPRVACTFCWHAYSFPCDGKDPKCMNAKWVRDMKAKEGNK